MAGGEETLALVEDIGLADKMRLSDPEVGKRRYLVLLEHQN